MARLWAPCAACSRLAAVLLLLATATSTSTSTSSSTVTVASRSTAVRLDAATGSLVAVEAAASPVDNYANGLPGSSSPFACVHLVSADAARSRTLTLSTTNFSSVSIVPSPRGDNATLVFAGGPVPGLGVSGYVAAHGSGGPTDGWLGFGGTVHNSNASWIVAQVVLPCLLMPAHLQGGGEDHLVLPWGGGGLLANPGVPTQSRTHVYPGTVHFQFTARYSGSEGLFVAQLDAVGHPKEWNLNTRGGHSVALQAGFVPPAYAGTDATIPFETALAVYPGSGDWRDAADLYKGWAEQQPFCAVKARDRQDIPAALREGATGIISAIAGSTGFLRDKFGPELERLPEFVSQYRNRSRANHVFFVPYGWEQQGVWAGIDYYPAQPSNAAWVNASARLRLQGNALGLLVSGYWWVVKRKQTTCGPPFDNSGEVAARRNMLIKKPDGSLFEVDQYDFPTGPQKWRGLSYKLCHGSSNASDTMVGIFTRANALGATLVSFDQEIGGASRYPCYDPTHGHPPGLGLYIVEGFERTARAIKAEAAGAGRELGLLTEQASELTMPFLATYWSRQFAMIDYAAFNATGAGIFPYLYHEYAIELAAAEVQGLGLGAPDVLMPLQTMVNAAVRGLVQFPFDQEVSLDPQTDRQRNCSALYFAIAGLPSRFPDHLVLGRTLRPPPVATGALPTWFLRASGRINITVPQVSVGAFRSLADGSVCIVLVTPSWLGPNPAAVDLSAFLAAGGRTVLHAANGTALQTWPTGPPPSLALSLEPFGARFLLIHAK